jgi:hypothetical protein
MVQLTPIDELRAIFASDDLPDGSRMRRLALIITMQMADRAAANALHQDIEAAISLFEDDPDAGRLTLALLKPTLADAGRRQ